MTLPLSAIRIGERRREDLGDITALARSRALVALAREAEQYLRAERKRLGPSAPLPTWVYFVFATPDGPVKIGASIDPVRRLKELRRYASPAACLLGVVPGGYAQEHALHQRFQHLHAYGEWFNAAPELSDYIRENAHEWAVQ